VRSHAESLAFLRGEAAVGQGLGRRFGALLANFERLIRWRSLVEQSSGLYGFLMQFVPYLVLSTAYFSGKVSLGDLTVGSIASLHRVVELETVLLGLPAAPGPPGDEPARHGGMAIVPPASLARLERAPRAAGGLPSTAWTNPGEAALRLQDLAVAHPGGGCPLLEGLDLVLVAGQRLLITGPSGSGKTTLLRVLCGLVPAAAGRIQLPAPERILVLPLQPFLPLGSLRDQILFPAAADASALGDMELRHLIKQVGLAAGPDHGAVLIGSSGGSAAASDRAPRGLQNRWSALRPSRSAPPPESEHRRRGRLDVFSSPTPPLHRTG
jgi:putative ATP-binding cassette transporter